MMPGTDQPPELEQALDLEDQCSDSDTSPMVSPRVPTPAVALANGFQDPLRSTFPHTALQDPLSRDFPSTIQQRPVPSFAEGEGLNKAIRNLSDALTSTHEGGKAAAPPVVGQPTLSPGAPGSTGKTVAAATARAASSKA